MQVPVWTWYLILVLPLSVLADLKQWSGSGPWTNGANWAPTGAPGSADDVLLASGTVILDEPAIIRSLTVTGGATLVFTNWTTSLTADDIEVLSNGVITCSGPFANTVMSNRIWLVATNLTVRDKGVIHADSRGYRAGAGPSPGTNTIISSLRGGGGGHGGKGGDGGPTAVLGGHPAGDPAEPLAPGSGGGSTSAYTGGAGGGAIRLEAVTAVIDGTLSANGQACPDQFAGAGAGGSISIACATLAGSGTGRLRANGGGGVALNGNGNGGEGAGGRISLAYNPAAQATSAAPAFIVQVLGGRTNPGPQADLGTIHLPDTTLLTDETLQNFSGQMLGFSSWSGTNVTLAGNWIRFPANGFALSVANDLRLTGATRLELGGNAYLPQPQTNIHGYLPAYAARYVCQTGTAIPSLNVGGDLLLTNSASLYIFSAPTNGASVDYGALLNVGGEMQISTGACLYPVVQPTNGGAPRLVFRTLKVLPFGAINSDGRGFPMGYGAGRSLPDNQRAGGAGHGGAGGKGAYGALGGVTYGDSNAPITPGSPPGRNTYVVHPPRWGGGIVRIEADQLTLDQGTLSASAEGGDGGSGGSIWIQARRFGGANGTLRARGGTVTDITRAGGGGGGRIAVRRGYDATAGTLVTDVLGGNGYQPGTNGTVVLDWLPLPGTVMLLK